MIFNTKSAVVYWLQKINAFNRYTKRIKYKQNRTKAEKNIQEKR